MPTLSQQAYCGSLNIRGTYTEAKGWHRACLRSFMPIWPPAGERFDGQPLRLPGRTSARHETNTRTNLVSPGPGTLPHRTPGPQLPCAALAAQLGFFCLRLLLPRAARCIPGIPIHGPYPFFTRCIWCLCGVRWGGVSVSVVLSSLSCLWGGGDTERTT